MNGPFENELAAAIQSARAAGEGLLSARGRFLAAREKSDGTLVTGADLRSEEGIVRLLRDRFPGDTILAEEGGEVAAGDDRRRWIVDPLDGTTNYSRGLPFFAVSIALWEGGRPAVGVVYLPVFDETFTAVRDGAAALNGASIRVSEAAAVAKAMVNVYFDRHARLVEGLEAFRKVALACEGRVKNMGSTASMLCYVASGRLDAFVRNSTRLWDFAAGALIVERAGGRITDFAGQPLRESGQSLLATNGRIHPELAGILRSQ